MKMLVVLAAACASMWCLGAQPAIAQQGGPSPQIVTGTLACDETCVDVYDIRCTQSSHRIQAVVSDAGCDDHFQATIIGYNPTSLIGVADAAATTMDQETNCAAPGVVVVRSGTAGTLRAVLTIHSFATSTNRNYSLQVACFSGDPGMPTFRNMSLQLVTHID